MELKPISIITFLFLFFILSLPNSFQGLTGEPDSAILEPEIYEIDYRGPETHSYVPPPIRSGSSGGRGRPSVHHHYSPRTHEVEGDDVIRRP